VDLQYVDGLDELPGAPGAAAELAARAPQGTRTFGVGVDGGDLLLVPVDKEDPLPDPQRVTVVVSEIATGMIEGACRLGLTA
jgi:hypothetical protein